MLFGFIISADLPLEPLKFSEDTEADGDLESVCFLRGGNLHCRECPWSGSCDSQDSYEYESEDW